MALMKIVTSLGWCFLPGDRKRKPCLRLRYAHARSHRRRSCRPAGRKQSSHRGFRKRVGTPPPAGTNAVIISHPPNILDALGKDYFGMREGEAAVLKPEGAGDYK